MKYILIILLIFIPAAAIAGELELFSPTLLCQKIEGRYKYEYYGGFYVKNTGKKEITIATEIASTTVSQRSDETYQIYFGIENVLTINDTALIPSIVDFRLVTLKPGEAASVSKKFNSNRLFENADMYYSIGELFASRFNFWSGYVGIDNVTVGHYDRCKL